MTEELHLPEECWELVFRFLSRHHHRHLEPLSVVSKRFLSITNRIPSSLSLTRPTPPSLFRRFPSLSSLHLTRFRGDLDALLLQIAHSPLPLNSLHLSHHPSVPSIGFRSLAAKFKSLTSLTVSHVGTLLNSDLLLIAQCFPLLQKLDLSFPQNVNHNNLNALDGPVSDFGVKALSLALPKLRSINLSGNYFLNDPSLFSLCRNCVFLEEVVIFDCHFITQLGIASAIRERPSLRSLSVNHFGYGTKRGDFVKPHVTSDFVDSLVSLKSLDCLDLSRSSVSDELLCAVAEQGLPLRTLCLLGCNSYSYDGLYCLLSKCQYVQHLDLECAEFLNDQRVEELSLFLGNLISINVSGCRMVTGLALVALIKNCPMLKEVRVAATSVGKKGLEGSLNAGVVNYKVKYLNLAHNSCLRDEGVKVFASICPNLEVLDLSGCCGVSKGVVEVLRRCREIRQLSLALCTRARLDGLDFELPKLEVLNLGWSVVDDEVLSVIAKCCGGLMQLELEHCTDVTAKGVRQVVENCTQLREINLKYCSKVAASVVSWMVFSRPSLRKIMAPPGSDLSDSHTELLMRHGCMVC